MLKLAARGRCPSRGDQSPPADSRCYPQCKVCQGTAVGSFIATVVLNLANVSLCLTSSNHFSQHLMFNLQADTSGQQSTAPSKREQTHGCTRPFFMPAEPTGKICSPNTPVYPGCHWSFPVVNQSFLIVPSLSWWSASLS